MPIPQFVSLGKEQPAKPIRLLDGTPKLTSESGYSIRKLDLTNLPKKNSLLPKDKKVEHPLHVIRTLVPRLFDQQSLSARSNPSN